MGNTLVQEEGKKISSPVLFFQAFCCILAWAQQVGQIYEWTLIADMKPMCFSQGTIYWAQKETNTQDTYTSYLPNLCFVQMVGKLGKNLGYTII